MRIVITDYIVAPDTYAAAGINSLLYEIGKNSIILNGEYSLSFLNTSLNVTNWRLSVVYPDDPHNVLHLTDRLARLIRCSSKPPCLLILADVPQEWLLLTLVSLGCPPGLLINIHILPLRISCSGLSETLSGKKPAAYCPQQPKIIQSSPPILTAGEYRAVINWLQGDTIPDCAIRDKKSVKTLYGQRHRGLCKLAFLFPELKPRNITKGISG